MKKFILILFFGLLAAPVFSQFEMPKEVNGMFETFTALVVGIPFIVEAVKRVFNPPAGFWTQLVSWITGIVGTMAGWFLKLGFLSGVIWWHALIIGLFASLAANGVFETNFPILLLKKLGILKN
jgi:hypothetical protein